MDGRTLVMGDWSPVVRDPIDLLRGAFVAGAAVFLLAGEPSAAVNLAVPGAAAIAVRFVNLPRVYDLCFVLAMAVAGWGEALRLYDLFGWFDVAVHASVPLLGAPVIYILLARLEVVPDPRDDTGRPHHAGIFVVTVAIGMAIGAWWEIIEWFSDTVLGSNLSPTKQDTIGDLGADTVGAVLGGALLVAWSVYGWGSVRRIPGDNRAEETNA
jgi:hypothetical protein